MKGSSISMNCGRLSNSFIYTYPCQTAKDDTNSWNGADSVVINVGESEDVVSYQKSISLHIWLFGYEFPETVLLFGANSLKILSSQKKSTKNLKKII
jgi:nucleosome binding factor SPN SPT16 subunit